MQSGSANTSSQLRYPVRDLVQKAGLLTFVRNMRAIARREVGRWVKGGCPSPAPNVVKMAIVRHHVETSSAKYFVETGTYLGSMVEHIAATGVRCTTIEIDESIYQRAIRILARWKNITLIKGDSAVELPKILDTLDDRAVFWLDGHYSGGFTGKADIDTPVSAELDMILNHKVKRHIVLIDDARDFNGTNGYPELSSVLAHFNAHLDYRAEVSADIIRILPRD